MSEPRFTEPSEDFEPPPEREPLPEPPARELPPDEQDDLGSPAGTQDRLDGGGTDVVGEPPD
ncbi:hypothetical protein Cme02nite_74190 [Catellatospora methionotrophica]|uniref:Uncharacterized protein n=1 Tax=Catellatospora methionotrophica TaxID=121620 RepID=A0A8J3LGU2_9ACTN|nr:hypothetical protein [Catellatospora methionotrophica]GIG19087.1 hypothetical protein Cme02nite_74190 [Catellatospora methionotrophica]